MRRGVARAIVGLVACAIALQTLLFSVLVVELEHHDCDGDHCVACQLVSTVRAVLEGTGGAWASGPAACLRAAWHLALAACVPLALAVAAQTPVTCRDLLVI